MLRLFFCVLLGSFLTGCITTSPTKKPILENKKQVDEFSMEGTYKMGQLIEGLLNKGMQVKLSIAVDAEVDPYLYSRDAKNTSSFIAYRLTHELRAYLGSYENFSIIDGYAIDDISKASHLFTIQAVYGKDQEWSGKVIDVKSNQTLGEYYCVMYQYQNVTQCN